MATYTVKSGRERLERIENSWEANAAGDKFAEIQLAEITADKTAIDAKLGEKANLEAQLKAISVELKDMTKASMKKCDFVVRAAEGDRKHGPDSALHAGFGYIRESEKKRGGRRKTAPTT